MASDISTFAMFLQKLVYIRYNENNYQDLTDLTALRIRRRGLDFHVPPSRFSPACHKFFAIPLPKEKEKDRVEVFRRSFSFR